MSDGSSKVAPGGAKVLDGADLAGSEGAEAAPKKAVAAPPRPAVSEPPRPRLASVVPAGTTSKDLLPSEAAPVPGPKVPAKVRDLTLRAPTPEQGRRDPPSGPSLGEESPSRPKLDDPDAAPLQPSRIIAINPEPTPPARAPSQRPAPRTDGPSRPALGLDQAEERGWTPYQPPVAPAHAVPPSGVRAEPPSEDIPLDFNTDPAIPKAPDTSPTQHVFEAEDIPIDDPDADELARVPESGEEAEVSFDDVVSVDSAPTPPARPPALSAPLLPPSAPSAPAPVPSASVPDAPATPAPVASSPSVLDAASFAVTPDGAADGPSTGEAPTTRRKAKPWWEELFNEDFIRTQVKLSPLEVAHEVDFIEDSLGCEAGATLLDLACGTGRHAVELAARGYQVVGFDLSLAMLARASEAAQDRGQKINFVQGDMREMQFEDSFDGIFAWNTSFGFFDEEKNNAVIARVHKALKKGGQFLLDVANRDYLVRQAPSLAWFEGDGCICMDEMQVDFITSRMRVKRTLMMDDGRTKEIEYSIRLYSLHELGKMLHDNGFRVAEVSGRTSTPGVFFGCESPRTLILAEKR